MKALHHLTDDDLVAVGNIFAGDLSYYVAGWDYTNTGGERAAELKCRRQSQPVDAEMKRRGLATTVPALCPLGVRP